MIIKKDQKVKLAVPKEALRAGFEEVFGTDDGGALAAAGFAALIDDLDRDADCAGEAEENGKVLGIAKADSREEGA